MRSRVSAANGQAMPGQLQNSLTLHLGQVDPINVSPFLILLEWSLRLYQIFYSLTLFLALATFNGQISPERKMELMFFRFKGLTIAKYEVYAHGRVEEKTRQGFPECTIRAVCLVHY